MANLWFTSDTHFGHAAILTFLAEGPDGIARPIRPEFTSITEMDETLVERWNEVVRPQDKVYHLGDVTIRKANLPIVRRLNGHKRLLRGNHDIFRTRDYLAAGFEEISASRVLDGIIFTHIPIHPWSLGRFQGNVHGHIHERAPFGPRYVNISVERTGYRPVSLDEVRLLVAQSISQESSRAEAANPLPGGDPPSHHEG